MDAGRVLRNQTVLVENGTIVAVGRRIAIPATIDPLRPDANAGRIPGPHVYAAFMVDSSPRYNNLFVTTPDEARAIAAIAKTNGYDFIKVYNDLQAAGVSRYRVLAIATRSVGEFIQRSLPNAES